MILRLPCLAAVLSLAAEALQAPSNAHVAITGPPPLAKAIGAKCVEVGAKFSIVVDASSRQAVRDVLEGKPPVTHVCDGGSRSAADVSPLFLECCGADLVRWCAVAGSDAATLVRDQLGPDVARAVAAANDVDAAAGGFLAAALGDGAPEPAPAPEPEPAPAPAPAPEPAPEAPPAEKPRKRDYVKLKVAELKDLLRGRGLKVSGKKAELVERLEASEED